MFLERLIIRQFVTIRQISPEFKNTSLLFSSIVGGTVGGGMYVAESILKNDKAVKVMYTLLGYSIVIFPNPLVLCGAAGAARHLLLKNDSE